ncbi:MAG: extracellular solute-binding protein [Lentihominibacter sp.]
MKRRRMNKIAAVVTVLIMALSLAAGCSSQSEKNSNTVTVYMWSTVLYDNYAQYIQEQNPDVDIQFSVGNNDLDYYRFLKESGELPDIITCRRFSLHDANPLRDQLMDLSSNDAASAVYESYINSFTNEDGTVNWVPLCGEADGLVVNKALFDRYNIPIPTDYDSLISACREFEKHGIRGFEADFAYDYTCMEILQGLSISEINSLEGRAWRSSYEDPNNFDVTGLDDEVWPEAFEKMEDFIKDVGLKEDDCMLDYDPVINRFRDGKVAMIRSGGSNVVEFNNEGIEAVFLPYFCDDGEEWLLTYPAFQAAVNKDVSENSEHEKAVMKVLNTMVSDGAQNSLAGGEDVITYSKDVNLKISPFLDNLKPLIEENRMYIRIASNDFFAASLDVVHRMIKGELDADSAYREMNRQLEDTSDEKAEIILSLDKSCSRVFSANGGKESSSAMANSLKECCGSDVVVAPAISFTETVIKGDYTEKLTSGMIMPNGLQAFDCRMTGAELKKYIEYSVQGIEGGFKPFNDGSLPAVSGISIEVRRDGDNYLLEKVLKDGKELEDGDRLMVTCLNTVDLMNPMIEASGLKFKMHDISVSEEWLAYIKGGGSVAAPESYITLR